MNIVFDTGSLETLARAFERFPDLAREEVGRFMHAATAHLQGEVIEHTPAAEGVLRGSIHPYVQEIPGGMLGGVGTALAYAEAVELGTRPHWAPIAPLEQWARTKLGLGPKEAASAARGIQRAIAARGTPAAGMFHRALAANAGEIARQFNLAMQRLRSRLEGVS